MAVAQDETATVPRGADEIARPTGRGRKGAAVATAAGDYVLDEQVGFLMRRAQQRHIAIFQRIMGDDGPTPTQFAAMAKLAAGEEISQNLLGRMTAMDPATIKGVIARLEERGLPGRGRAPARPAGATRLSRPCPQKPLVQICLYTNNNGRRV